MALRSTVFKGEIQISDLDRHYYGAHPITLARHPSETDERMMVRLLAFILNADERLQFGRGLSNEEEPALYLNHDHGEIDLWIDVGTPDEKRLRKAASRSDRVVVYVYGGRPAQIWWEKTGPGLARMDKLTLWMLDAETSQGLAALAERGMRLNALIQDGSVEISDEEGNSVSVHPHKLQGA